jgi:uncharacterized protein YcfJ
MKHAFTLAIAFVLAVAASFSAQAKDVVGNIVRVTPVHEERLVKHQVCDVVRETANTGSAINSGSVIGGIAGALLGSQAGGGNGRVALAALGAVTGAMTGDRLVQTNAQPQQACRWVQRSEHAVVSYRVTYEVDGEQYQLSMPWDPSEGGGVKTIPVRMVPTIARM